MPGRQRNLKAASAGATVHLDADTAATGLFTGGSASQPRASGWWRAISPPPSAAPPLAVRPVQPNVPRPVAAAAEHQATPPGQCCWLPPRRDRRRWCLVAAESAGGGAPTRVVADVQRPWTGADQRSQAGARRRQRQQPAPRRSPHATTGAFGVPARRGAGRPSASLPGRRRPVGRWLLPVAGRVGQQPGRRTHGQRRYSAPDTSSRWLPTRPLISVRMKVLSALQ